MRLSEETRALLRCPRCHAALKDAGECFQCTNSRCGVCYPVVNGAPVLIDDARSVFSIADFTHLRPTYAAQTAGGPTVRFRRAMVSRRPSIGANHKAGANYSRLLRELFTLAPRPRVLVVGGGVPGEGMGNLIQADQLELIETDIRFGTRPVALMADGHEIPFADGSFDGALVQAVLEHVMDPIRCVAEVHRVLRPGGLVYAETPFMQQVHGGKYDFTRFTYAGHRRVFRDFEEVASGALGGPAIVLAWAWKYFLRSFGRTAGQRRVLETLAHLTAFWLPYLDPLVVDTPAGFDGGWAFYFLGRRAEQSLSDRDLLSVFRGT